MSTAIARNLMAEMKLLGMFDAFDRLVTELPDINGVALTSSTPSYRPRMTSELSAKQNGVSRPPSSHCVPPSRTSTLPPTALLPGRKSRTSIVCIGCRTRGRCC